VHRCEHPGRVGQMAVQAALVHNAPLVLRHIVRGDGECARRLGPEEDVGDDEAVASAPAHGAGRGGGGRSAVRPVGRGALQHPHLLQQPREQSQVEPV
jgi:hypothetical protein